MDHPAPARRLPLELGAAAAGLIGGHIVSYLMAAPAGPIRELLLAQTGHGYMPRAIAAGAALGAVALIAAVFRGARRGWRSEGVALSFAATFARLAVAQTIGFVILEILERKAAGATLQGLAGLLPRGLLIQVIVAAVAALALWLLDRAAATIASALREELARRPESAILSQPIRDPVVRRTLVALETISLRGPPLPSRI